LHIGRHCWAQPKHLKREATDGCLAAHKRTPPFRKPIYLSLAPLPPPSAKTNGSPVASINYHLSRRVPSSARTVSAHSAFESSRYYWLHFPFTACGAVSQPSQPSRRNCPDHRGYTYNAQTLRFCLATSQFPPSDTFEILLSELDHVTDSKTATFARSAHYRTTINEPHAGSITREQVDVFRIL